MKSPMPSAMGKKAVVILRGRDVPRSPACPQTDWGGTVASTAWGRGKGDAVKFLFTTQTLLIKYLMRNHTPDVSRDAGDTHHQINTRWLTGTGVSLLPHHEETADIPGTEPLCGCWGSSSGPHTCTSILLTKLSPQCPLLNCWVSQFWNPESEMLRFSHVLNTYWATASAPNFFI